MGGGRSLPPPPLSTPRAGHGSSSSGCAQRSPRASQASPGNGQKAAAKLTKRSCEHKAPNCLLTYVVIPSDLRNLGFVFVAQSAVKTAAGEMSQVNASHKPTAHQGKHTHCRDGQLQPSHTCMHTAAAGSMHRNADSGTVNKLNCRHTLLRFFPHSFLQVYSSN